MTERLLTARELAEYLGLSASTVLDRFERGDLPGFRLFRKGGPVRFRPSEIEHWLEAQRAGQEEKLSTTPRKPAREVVSQASTTPHRGGENAR